MATIAEQMQMRSQQVFPQPPASPNTPNVPTMTPTGVSASGGLMTQAPAPAMPAAPSAPGYDDSAASNLAKITSSDSPLMKMAGAAGMAAANRRGLLNSTMAVGAAQGEMIKAATPIALADAATAGQKNMQNTDITAQMQRLQITNDAEMGRLERQLANANDQQKVDIQAQMDRLSATNTAEMARLQEQGRIQGGLQTQQNTADMQRLQEQGRITGGLNAQQNEAEMARLTASMAGATAQQKADIQAQMDRLVYGTQADSVKQQRDIDNQKFLQSASFANETAQKKTELAARMSELTTQIASQQAMQTQSLSEEAKRQQVQLGVQQAMQSAEFANLNQQQKNDIAAQMERLVTSGQQEITRLQTASTLEGDRMKLQNTLDTALQTTGAQQQALAKVQGDIQSKLQAQTDTAAMSRLSAQFAQDLTVQSNEEKAALQRIAASGDQNVRQALIVADQERQNLAMQLASGDREKVANTAIQIFQSEAAMRAALLQNTSMPAAERSAYEAAIASLGNPVRQFINQLYGGTPQAAAAVAPPPAPVLGGVTTSAPDAMVAPPAGDVSAGGNGLYQGAYLSQQDNEGLSAIQRRQKAYYD